ncbi:MAG: peptidylprolyl isomerase [Candidatus Saccharimonadales bacterium]
MKKHKISLKKIRKLPKPRLPKRLRRLTKEELAAAAIQSIPQITNETVAEHREEVLSSARKYIYPLQHSKYRIVIVSASLLITAIIAFFVYIGFELYKFQSSSAFMYRITQVAPLPVAKVGPSYVAYENYLFELRRYIHYYHTQQNVDFDTAIGRQQLEAYKPKAMQQVIDATYVKQLAVKNGISVSSAEVNREVSLLKKQNQLTGGNKELSDITSEFFGWSVNDLKRELKQELLSQKLVSKLDTTAHSKATSVEQQLKSGADFAVLATKYSDDLATAKNGGQFANEAITVGSTDVPPRLLGVLTSLQAGQVSSPVDIGSGLEIVKIISNDGGKIKAAHIYIQFKSLESYLKPARAAHPAHIFISVKLD